MEFRKATSGLYGCQEIHHDKLLEMAGGRWQKGTYLGDTTNVSVLKDKLRLH